MIRVLDRYILREWTRVFALTSLGFPVLVTLFDLTDKLDRYLSRGISRGAVALSYLYGFPELLVVVLPVAVLFATVFTVSTLGRHSELTAAKASGQSFHRLIRPLLLAASVSAVLAFALSEMSAPAASRQLELRGEKAIRSRTGRYNFVYRADGGWVYLVRSLEIAPRELSNILLLRRGTGIDYPTLAIAAQQARFTDDTAHGEPGGGRWVFKNGQYRVLGGPGVELAFGFDSMSSRHFRERPEDLLAESKRPEEMRYGELKQYIDALERSGSEVKKLKAELMLKLSIPLACIVIAAFGAPLAITTHRSGPAAGVAVSLGVTGLFLLSFQLSKAIGASGLLPPSFAAWLPNLLWGIAALYLLRKAPT
jgi:lipopolysaccharide export system permease protein